MTDEREPFTDAELTQLEYAASRHPQANATQRLIAEVRRLRAEKADLINCAHTIHTPVTSVDWCPKCGAVAVEGQWQKTVS